MGIYLPRLFHFFQTHLHPIASTLTVEALKEIQEIYLDINQPKDSGTKANASLLRVLQNFHTARSYIRIGHMALLSHFGLIEALITHEPKATAGDSLSHQVSTKMPLLFRRFKTPLDPSLFFKNGDLTLVWKRLYEVRSLFAHGEDADFSKGPLVLLNDFAAVEKFVYLALKRLLKVALKEPDLVYDLKLC